MKITLVAVAAGAGYTDVVATGAFHAVRAIGNEAPLSTTWEVEFPGDNYVGVHQYAPGRPIERIGLGKAGILAPPPGYFAANTPATGGIYFKIRDKSGVGGSLRLMESTVEIPDNII